MGITIEDVVDTASVIPVLVIEKLEHAVPLAKALYRGGLSVLEITLRTSVALEAIRAIKAELPEVIVGAGTVTGEDTMAEAIEAGAEFLVSPGATTALIGAAQNVDIPFLAGVSTPSEVMVLLDKGLSVLKFFPAEAAGGVSMLKSINGPLPQLRFCPTGGITYDKAKEYLSTKNVACVGGSWITPKILVDSENWEEIEALARSAAALA